MRSIEQPPVPSSITTTSRTCTAYRPLRLHRGLGVEHAPREPRKLGVGVRIATGEIRARAHDAVEVVPELDLPAEHALVHGAIGRRVVREAYPARAPVHPEELMQHPISHADDELGRLPHGAAMPDHEILPQDDDVRHLLDAEQQRLVQPPSIGDESVDGKP